MLLPGTEPPKRTQTVVKSPPFYGWLLVPVPPFLFIYLDWNFILESVFFTKHFLETTLTIKTSRTRFLEVPLDSFGTCLTNE